MLNIHNAFHQGQYQEVIDFDTIALSPENAVPAQALKYRAQIACGQARNVVDSIGKESDSKLESAAVKALAQYTLGKSSEAEQEANKLLESSPENSIVQVMVGTVLQALGRTEDALGLLSKHQGNLEAYAEIAFAPQNPSHIPADRVICSIALIVQIHLQQNRTDLALKEVTAARKWAQDSLLVNIAESWVGLRVVRLTLYQLFCLQQDSKMLTFGFCKGGDKYQQAFYVYEEMAQTQSTSAAKSFIGQAVAELHLGRLPEAEAALQQAIEKDPQNTEAIANSIVLNVLSRKDPTELTK